MKKYIFGLMAVAAAMFMASCSADEGTEPGGDSKAYVMTNTYSVAPPLDADADFKVRVSTNSATESAYILLEKHAEYTGSPRAKAILADWDSYRGKFVKVYPNEYRRALKELAAAKQQQKEIA